MTGQTGRMAETGQLQTVNDAVALRRTCITGLKVST